MTLILIVTANFFVLIICLIAAQASYFSKKWKCFFLMLVCIVLTGGCISVEVYQWLFPPAQELPLFIRQPTTPL